VGVGDSGLMYYRLVIDCMNSLTLKMKEVRSIETLGISQPA
jgi:hypothetical protein